MSYLNDRNYFELNFDSTGSATDNVRAHELLSAVAAGAFDDIVFFAPGWHATVTSARALHRDLFAILGAQLGARAGRTALVGVHWPSLLFPEDDPATELPTPSTGAQLANALAPAFPAKHFQLDELGELLDRRPADLDELERFHDLAGRLVTSPSLSLDDSGEANVLSADTVTLFGLAATMSKTPVTCSQNRADPYPLLWSGARQILRAVTYYEMKNRAGVVGRDGLGRLIAGLQGTPRCHLVGHSFGARLVAYALAGLDEPTAGRRSPVKSLYLIQGALSHFAFTTFDEPGQLRSAGSLAGLVDRVDGPLISTYSSHDRCLGWWYPSISLLNHDHSRSVSELAYRWGALGHDGFQGSGTQQRQLAAVGEGYRFRRGGQYLLDASAVIATNQSTLSGAHSDIRHPAVLWPVVSALTADRAADEPAPAHLAPADEAELVPQRV